MLDATKLLKVGMNEELRGLLAKRTDDESGSYLVEGLNSFDDSVLTADRRDKGEVTADQFVITTMPGRGYVKGVEVISPGEHKVVNRCLEYDAVESEPQSFIFGDNIILLNKGNWPEAYPIESVTRMTGPVRVVEEITRGAIPNGSDEVGNTPLYEILAVTSADGVGGASPAELTTPNTAAGKEPFDIIPDFVAYPTDPYILNIEVGEYGSYQHRILTYHICGGSWSAEEICEALNNGRGPAYWKYSGDSAPYNLRFEAVGTAGSKRIQISSLSCSGKAYIKIRNDSEYKSPIAVCLGFTGGEEVVGAGTDYNEGTDYSKVGNFVNWDHAGSKPNPGTVYRVVYTYVKTFEENIDYRLPGNIGSIDSPQTCSYAVTACNKGAKGEETKYSNVYEISAKGAVLLFWAGVTGATHYNVYRASGTNMRFIGRTDRTYFRDVGDFTPVIDYPYSTSIEGVRNLPSYKMSEVSSSYWKLRRNITFKVAGGMRPVDGGIISIDYNYYIPRYILRVVDTIGQIHDIIGQAEENPQIPPIPEGMLPIATIYNLYYHALNVENYNRYRLTMNDLQNAMEEIIELKRDFANQQLLNEGLLGKEADIIGMFVENFDDKEKMDESDDEHECLIRPNEGVLTLPQEIYQRELDVVASAESGRQTTAVLKSKYALLAYESELLISQDQWSSFMRINPYTAWDDSDPIVELNPKIDYWVDEALQATSSVTQIALRDSAEHDLSFNGDGIERWRQYLAGVLPRYFRSRDVVVSGKGFHAGDEVSATFAGRTVDLIPYPGSGTEAGSTPGTVLASAVGTEDPGGQFQAVFSIPEGIQFIADQRAPWRAKAVVSMTDESGNSGQTYYIASARVALLDDHIEKLNYRNDPLAQIISWEGESPIFIDKIVLPLPEPEVAAIPLGTVLTVLVRNCRLGIPDDELIARAVFTYYGREPIPGQQNSYRGLYCPGSNNHLIFDDPIFLPSSLYEGACAGLWSHTGDLAVCLLSNSPYLRAYVARLGEQGQNPQGIITQQPYQGGVLLSSADAVSWTPHQTTDLRFKLYRCKFDLSGDRGWLAFSTIDVDDITEIELIAPGFCPSSECGIVWQYQTQKGIRRTWFNIEPNQPIRFESPQSSFSLSCKLTSTNNYLSPMVMHNDLLVILRKNKSSGGYVSKTSYLTQDFDAARVVVQMYTPAGATQKIYISNDDGTTWHQLTGSYLENIIQIDDDWMEYSYDLVDAGPISVFAAPGRKFKVKILQSAAPGNTASAPEARKLRVITYSIS